MKKLAIIGTRGYPSYYGGFETAVRKLAPYFSDRGWTVSVYGRRNSTSRTDSERDPRVLAVNTIGLESKSLSTLTFGLTSMIHAFFTKPDVALIMNVANGYWLPILKVRKVPTIVNVDGIEWDRDKWGRIAKAIFKGGAWMTAKFADELIADSKVIQARWRAEFKRSSVFIAYGGDEPADVAVDPSLIPGSYILLVARFVPENSVEQFFLAVDELRGKYPVVIVGSSGYGSDLDAKAKELSEKYENVSWLGHVSDDLKLSSLWKHSGVYFHGHSVGGTNPALVQAMASGCAIVARDTKYNREVLSTAALFVEPRPASIAEALKLVLEDGQRSAELRRTALQRAREFYTWDLICRKYDHEIIKLSSTEERQVITND